MNKTLEIGQFIHALLSEVVTTVGTFSERH